MHLETVEIHNFRSIQSGVLNIGNYSLIVGANNCGKSNALDAIRMFYDDLKFDADRDFPKFATRDCGSWIQLTFALTSGEFGHLQKEYQDHVQKLILRRYLILPEDMSDTKLKVGSIYAVVDGNVMDQPFYNTKAIAQGRLGKAIYIPAASKVEDHLKMTGKSTLRELVAEITQQLVSTSAAYSDLRLNIEEFTEALKVEKTADDRSLSGLMSELNSELSEWGASINLDPKRDAEKELLNSLIEFQIRDHSLDESLDPSQFGQGLQRHIIFALLRLAARHRLNSTPSSEDEFYSNYSLLLFEEPEAFLHPPQQRTLATSLRTIAEQEGNQVLITTHSPNFVSHNAEDIPSIVRFCREDKKTLVGQMSSEDLEEVFTNNQEINQIASNVHPDDLELDMETVKHYLWLDPERSGMFFSRHVLLVEGPTEKVLINYLVDSGALDVPSGGTFILDCMGKYNVHRFMNILGPMQVSHSVLIDGDSNQGEHKEINELIEQSGNDRTHMIKVLPKNLESTLGIVPPRDRRRKPQHLMLQLKKGTIDQERLDTFVKVVQDLIPA